MLDDSQKTCSERGEQTALSICLYWRGYVERLAGDVGAEERTQRTAIELTEAMGEVGMFGAAQVELAWLLAMTDRLDEAEQHAAAARASASVDDFLVQARSRSALALVAARRGEPDVALALANEAVEIATPSDWLHARAATLEDRAAVEAAAGRADEARRSLADALALHERKGNVAAAIRARRLEDAGA